MNITGTQSTATGWHQRRDWRFWLGMTGCVAFGFVAALHLHARFIAAPDVPDGAGSLADYVPKPVVYEPERPGDPRADFWARLAADIELVSEELTEPARRRELEALQRSLIEQAAVQVREGDEARLGATLALLGEINVELQSFDAAALYLAEALDVFQRLGDDVGVARTEFHLGRMHLRLRQRARTAGQAYDRLLVARWQLARGHLGVAEENLQIVVEENLSINRFGAAASALASLQRLYDDLGEPALAEQAAGQAAELYAAAGQRGAARDVLADLTAAGVSANTLADIEAAVERRHAVFERDVAQLAAARDYDRLESYYRSQGDVASAWQLRLRADASLREVSRREMYHRIPDVLALLYTSNADRDQARAYFESAGEVFAREGLGTLQREAETLHGDVL